jgi:NAD+ synthase (glutamine-hydrolysing)
MAKKLRIVLAQLNMKVGDIAGNLEKHIKAANTARDVHKADIIVFPELSLVGYPPEDLLLRPSFIAAANDSLNSFKAQTQGIHCIVGHPQQTSTGLLNTSSIVFNGTILGRYSKQYLPNYSIFDECRYFTPNLSPCVIPINGIPIGLLICEDLWHPSPIHQAAVQGARIIIANNASPFEPDKHERRLNTLAKRAKAANLPIIYVNTIGGQDELVFDGGSMIVDQTGSLCQYAGFANETLHPVEIEISSTDTNIPSDAFSVPDIEQRIYDCLVMGVRDYVHKNGFKGAIIGVSGGIDSALTLAIAVDALGSKNITAVYMPSHFNAAISEEDAITLAKNLGVEHQIISIEPSYNSFLKSLEPAFTGKKPDVTEENIQSRCRGLILMALSNKSGRLVLTTGNRSEFAVGYATIYGDMAGGFAVLKDVPKTMVYRLARYRNNIKPVIPQRTIERAPTAELAFDQKDEDTLPPYPILDKILELYLNSEQGIDEIIAQGFAPEIVKKVVNMIKKNEYKRRQAPVGTRINHQNFGRGWRYPITSGFKG